MSLPYLHGFGWEATCVSVRPECVEGVLDQRLEASLPVGTRNICTHALRYGWTRKVGLGSLALRAMPYLHAAGNNLLAGEHFDLIFFSTTQFPVMALGPGWKKRFGVPYVLDFQDPWRNDYYERTGIRPPGGRFKYAFARLQARLLEPYSLKPASHSVCVSPAYPSMFRARYSWLGQNNFTVLPFGAAESDFKHLRTFPDRQNIFRSSDGRRHWVYVGACIPAMELALRSLFEALTRVFRAQPELRENLQIHFIGTSYAPKGRAVKTVEPLAVEFGLEDIVGELTDRISYFEALECLQDAHALIVPGSNDAGYTASKIYSCILARKPLLAIFHAKSSVVDVLKKTNAGTVIDFETGESVESVAGRVAASGWLQNPQAPSTNWSEFQLYTAHEMTRKLCQVFDQCIQN